MPRILIIGNSGAARECYWVLRDVMESAPGLAHYYSFGGFLDWKGYAGDLKDLRDFYLGTATTRPDRMTFLSSAWANRSCAKRSLRPSRRVARPS